MKIKKIIIFLAVIMVGIAVIAGTAVGNREDISSVFHLAKEREKLDKNGGRVLAKVGDVKIYESQVERYALQHEFKISSIKKSIETEENQEVKARLSESLRELQEKSSETISQEALERLITLEVVRQVCDLKEVEVSDKEVLDYYEEMMKLNQQLVEKGQVDILEEYQLGSGESEKEEKQRQLDAYRDLLESKALYEVYLKEVADRRISYEDWCEQEYAKISVKRY